MRVTVLYEDRRGDDNDFGLHDFVCQCVIDRLGWTSKTLYDIRKTTIQGVPAGGDSNLRKKCRQDLKTLADRNARVFALYDEDKAARLVKLTGNPCRPLICEHLAQGCEPAEKLEVVLLRRNTETVIETIRDSGLTTIQDTVFAVIVATCETEFSVAVRVNWHLTHVRSYYRGYPTSTVWC